VQGGAVTVEQAGLGQHHRASVDTAKDHPIMVKPAQRLLQLRPITGQRLEASYDQQHTSRFALP
jgi:hypothetical protein